MAEKLVPPIKKTDRADGVKQGSANKTLTTPNDSEGKVWSKGSQTEKIF